MGASKSSAFTKKQNNLALLAKALAHPARIAIVELLLKKQSCVCGTIVDELPLAQATISQHLKELKAAGIIKGSISGNSICYCLEPKTIQTLSDFLNQLSSFPSPSKCC